VLKPQKEKEAERGETGRWEDMPGAGGEVRVPGARSIRAGGWGGDGGIRPCQRCIRQRYRAIPLLGYTTDFHPIENDGLHES
jgi:hypothetical protein